jgi:deoxyribodipyrimidine photo-lyase
LEQFANRAAVVVADDYPCFFLPHAVAAAAKRLEIRLEAVDGNELIPLSALPREYPAAFRGNIRGGSPPSIHAGRPANTSRIRPTLPSADIHNARALGVAAGRHRQSVAARVGQASRR